MGYQTDNHQNITQIKSTRKESISDLSDGSFEKELRIKWKVGDKCIVFSTYFEKWIFTNIEKIDNQEDEERLIVVNHGPRDRRTDTPEDTVSFNRFSHNIQPIYMMNDDYKIQDVYKKCDDIDINKINQSFYVSRGLEKYKENESRIKWNVGQKCLIFYIYSEEDEQKNKKKW